MESLFFTAEYNEENVDFARSICDQETSMIGYWLKDLDYVIKYDDLMKNESVIATTPREPDFIEFMRRFLWEGGYSPDFLIIKGWIVDSWAVSALKRSGQIEYPMVLIANDVVPPFSGFDLMLLDQFDKILVNTYKFGLEDYLRIGLDQKNEDSTIYDVFEKILILEELKRVFCNLNCIDNKDEHLPKILEGIFRDMKKNKQIAAFTI